MLYPTHILNLIRSTLAISLALFLSTNLAASDDFIIQPTSLFLAAKKPTATVELINSGTEPKIVKIQVMSLSKESGREQLSPSNRLLVHPAQVTLQPGATQSVLVGMRMSGPLWHEETYRLLLTEVQQAANVGASATIPRNPLSLRLAILPVSVLPPGQSLSGR